MVPLCGNLSRSLFRDYCNCNFVKTLIFLEIVTIAKYTKHCITFPKFRNATVYTKNITPSGVATAVPRVKYM